MEVINIYSQKRTNKHLLAKENKFHFIWGRKRLMNKDRWDTIANKSELGGSTIKIPLPP